MGYLVAQLCPTLFNHMDYSPPGSSVRGISQARILEPVAIPYPGIKSRSPALQVATEPPEKPRWLKPLL